MAQRIAAYTTGEADPMRVPTDRWRPLLGILVSQRLTGLAVAALEGGSLELTDEQHADLLERQREAMLRSLATERTLLELAGSLSDIGVSSIVLKGPALAHTVYPEPEWRPFGDLDLLVRGRDWASARSAVETLGFRRNVPEPRPGFDVRFGKAATHSNADGLQVDLHRTLVLGPFGLWIEPEALFSATTEFSLGGRRLMRLDDEALFLHACVHASLGWAPPLLLPVRDVAQIGAGVRLDRSVMADRIRAWRLAPVVAHALEVAEELSGTVVPALDGVLDGIDVGEVERKALLAYTTGRRRRGGLDLSMVQAIPGLRAKAAYLRDLLVPTKEFLEARSRGANGRGSYRRRWTVPLGWMKRNTVISRRRKESHVRYRGRP